jgi:hypothetical protein
MNLKRIRTEDGQVYYIDGQTKQRVPTEAFEMYAYTAVYGMDKWLNFTHAVAFGAVGGLMGQSLSCILIHIQNGLLAFKSGDGSETLATIPLSSIQGFTCYPASDPNPYVGVRYTTKQAAYASFVFGIVIFLILRIKDIGGRIAAALFISAAFFWIVLMQFRHRNPLKRSKDKTWIDLRYFREEKEHHFYFCTFPKNLTVLLDVPELRGIQREVRTDESIPAEANKL